MIVNNGSITHNNIVINNFDTPSLKCVENLTLEEILSKPRMEAFIAKKIYANPDAPDFTLSIKKQENFWSDAITFGHIFLIQMKSRALYMIFLMSPVTNCETKFILHQLN